MSKEKIIEFGEDRVLSNRPLMIIITIQHNNKQGLTTVRDKRERNRLSLFLYSSYRTEGGAMHSRDVRRLSDDEKYVLLFFFFFSPSDTKMLSIFLVSCFCSSSSTSSSFSAFFFRFFFPFPSLVYLIAATIKTNIISNRQRQEMKGKKHE